VIKINLIVMEIGLSKVRCKLYEQILWRSKCITLEWIISQQLNEQSCDDYFIKNKKVILKLMQ